MVALNGSAAPSFNNRLASAALEYAGVFGLPVFPCRPGEKEPLTSHGFKDASLDETQIARWWSQAPNANIGMATGNGVLVLDVDGAEGEVSLAALLAVHGPLPATPEQRTGKGRHLLFSVEGRTKNTCRMLGAGLDTRGDGGYIIVAPSIHPNGTRYEWVAGRSPSDIEIAPAPVWLIGLTRQKNSEKASEGLRRPNPADIPDAYTRAAVDGEYNKVATAPSGTRNAAVNDAAFALGQLVGAGALDETIARRTLEAAADACGVLREERGKTLGTIARGLAAGIEEPRDLSGVGRASERPPAPRDSAHGNGTNALPAHHRPQTQGKAERPDPLPVATAWAGVDPAAIPRRRWLYGRYLCRGIVSLTVSPGGVGKSSLAIVEAIQMATGHMLHDQALPGGPVRVWYINLEDPPDELDRRLAGSCLNFGIKYGDLAGRLFINSGVETPLKLAALVNSQGHLDEAAFDHLEKQIKTNQIDAIVVDPFVSSHDLPESDNGMIDRLAKRWSRLAMRCNVAVGLVHHTKKLAPGLEHDADSARGASSLINTARVVRVLNPMSTDEAKRANISPELRRLHFRASRDKQNLAPPDADKNWYKMVGVNLGNGSPPHYIDSDEVGVAERWQWPTDAVAAEIESVAAKRMDTLRRDVLDGLVSCLSPSWMPPREVVARLQTVADVNHGRQRIIDILESLANEDGDGTTSIEHGDAKIEIETHRTPKRTHRRFRMVRDQAGAVGDGD